MDLRGGMFTPFAAIVSLVAPVVQSCVFIGNYVGWTDQVAGRSFLSAEAAAAVGCTFPGVWWAGA